MANNIETFKKDLDQIGIQLNDHQLEQFMKYYEYLVEWNGFMNLTAITEFDEVCKKHFIDSLTLINAKNQIFKLTGKDITKDEITLIDIGTGAGFPGIPLKIAFPNLKIVLLDSLNKRIKFLNHIIDNLELKDIKAIHGRAEDYARDKEYRDQFDLCVSRAVANMSTLSEYCLPYVRKDGLFIPFKSEKITEELACANHALYLLGSKLIEQIDYQLPDSDIYRNLVIIKKEKATPKAYPRKAGLPSKEPLK